ncbi:MAG TPA: hypothetical protein ENN06_03345 [Desulfobacteraceae bacterium]|nr:hypothetical protein [Desulfobacteraceae bacterium]
MAPTARQRRSCTASGRIPGIDWNCLHSGIIDRHHSPWEALWAKKFGYNNVLRHPGGIFAWKGAGYPTWDPAVKVRFTGSGP